LVTSRFRWMKPGESRPAFASRLRRSPSIDPCIGDGAAFSTIAGETCARRYGVELDAYRAEQATAVVNTPSLLRIVGVRSGASGRRSVAVKCCSFSMNGALFRLENRLLDFGSNEDIGLLIAVPRSRIPVGAEWSAGGLMRKVWCGEGDLNPQPSFAICKLLTLR
jgi:hypothetical protein